MNPINIRTATIHDVAAILDIYNDAVLKTTATYDLEPQDLATRTAWLEEHVLDALPVFVAEINDAVAGWGALNTFRSKPGYRFTVEDSVYVAEDHRGRGVGKALLARLIVEAREMGKHAIVAGIDADAVVSIRLHAAFGFEQVANFKQVGYKFDRWLDVVFMELILT